MLWVLCFQILVSVNSIEDSLTVLTDVNFADSLLNKQSLVLFYDPYCGSSNLAYSEYKEAAKLIGQKENFVIGKVDVNSNKNLADAFQVTLIPSLYFFTSFDHHAFPLQLTKENIVKYTDLMLNPTLSRIESIDKFLLPGIVSFVLFDEPDSKLARKMARVLRFENLINVGTYHQKDFSIEKKLNFPGFYAINTFHNIYIELNDFAVDSVISFVRSHNLHKKMPISAAYSYVIDQHLPAVYIFAEKDLTDTYSLLINDTISEIGDLRIVYGDLNEHPTLAHVLGISPSSQPILTLIEPIGNSFKKFKTETDGIFKSNILKLINSWKSGEAERYYKSTAPVKGELVGANFEKTIQKTFSDTLVHFYAPWCEICKGIKEILDNLQAKIEGLKVYVMNADDNEVPGHLIDEFPTVKFYYPRTEKWYLFKDYADDGTGSTLSERIIKFIKASKKDQKPTKTANFDEDL